MPKIHAKCQKFMQKLWNFIFCHLNIVKAVFKLSFKLLVRSVDQIKKLYPHFCDLGGVYVTNIEGFAMVVREQIRTLAAAGCQNGQNLPPSSPKLSESQ